MKVCLIMLCSKMKRCQAHIIGNECLQLYIVKFTTVKCCLLV